MKRTLLSIALLTGLSTSAMASDNEWEKDAKDAWIDGKAEATLLFNGNLNSFDINTDVEQGIVTLTGKVETKIDKELATELVMGIDGVSEVENMLSVVNTEVDQTSDIAANYTDAKISTVITSRFLFNSEVSGLDIDVDVDNRNVTLNGVVASQAEKDLAITIAENANDVLAVNDNLVVETDAE